MPKSLVYRELVLHSPSVLLPRTARLYAKLTRELGRVPESFVHGVLVLHSPSILYASLQFGASAQVYSPSFCSLTFHF